MQFTGERYIPTVQGQIRLEHYHRYMAVLDVVSGKDVLDLACGEGYGSFLMAGVAHTVTGIDIAEDVIRHAGHAYGKQTNLAFRLGSATTLHLDDASFDIVVSFETIEHLAEQSKMLAEIGRVLRPSGVLVLSSPNRPVYAQERDTPNEFHVKELDFGELNVLIKAHFPCVRYFGQRLMAGSVIQSLDEPRNLLRAWNDSDAGLSTQPARLTNPVYFLAVCAFDETNLPDLEGSVLHSTDPYAPEKYQELVRQAQSGDEKLQQLHSQYRQLDQLLEAMRRSTSWRITLPLRMLRGALPGATKEQRGVLRSGMYSLLSGGIGLLRLIWRRDVPKPAEKHLQDTGAIAVQPHFSPPRNDYALAVPFLYRPLVINAAPSLAVICHMFFDGMAEEIRTYLLNIPFSFDLYITTDTLAKKKNIERIFGGWQRGSVEVRIAPNRGRDIAPKLIACADVYGNHEYVLHIHTKLSPYADVLAGWRKYLMETLVGSPEIVNDVFEIFQKHPNVGMIASQHFEAVRPTIGWSHNQDPGVTFLRRLGLDLDMEADIDFPSGSMFWARSAALTPLLRAGLSGDDFPPETGQRDGTVAHVIERLYFHVCEAAGFDWIKIAKPDLLDKTRHRVVNIKSPEDLDEFIAAHRVRLLTRQDGKMPERHFVEDWERAVASLVENHPLDEAMSIAVGGKYQVIGQMEAQLLKNCGLTDGMRLIDMGCGSGRLAAALHGVINISYVGIDVVQSLLDYARTKAPTYEFLLHRDLTIPQDSKSADMICAFSLFTHLLHTETYLYLEEAKRVLKPGGRIVFSFLEFAEPGHWRVFDDTKNAQKVTRPILNMFIERNAIGAWAANLDLVVERFIAGVDFVGDFHAPWQLADTQSAAMQSVVVLRKRAP